MMNEKIFGEARPSLIGWQVRGCVHEVQRVKGLARLVNI